ncbi:MAG: SDR family NAD(P)-dependent oxidoreductase [Chloroflexota bacterium]
MNYVIVGASAGVGRALAYQFARAGHNLVVAASDARDLEATASDLRIRCGVQVTPVVMDLARIEETALRQIEQAAADWGGLHGLLLPAGAVSPDDTANAAAGEFDRLTRVNYLSMASVIQRLLPLLQGHPAVIVGFGSVAAMRGRGRNVAYAAAKRALESYFESLRHAFSNTDLKVQFYVLGYMNTQMAFGMRTPLPKADPGKLSRVVLANVARDIGVVYYPRFWRLMHWVVRSIPWPLYKRMQF